ncbi:hypothetical protein [Beggiatoa leptomitoformis]|uniref:Glycosyltransferase RgtA/B/C/D-like domain-containing protein n=1 Tax=Beggiatoa leptomitoformis TaxID=288004 RepID=A0A2N9YE95_9GAMM|nr:hypothetical protein [Beggiatoa leptomitoformis]ALG68823.1 hypothetical protein AL038_15360 [Beggiatoa leptomitoformis]AUI68813.1 hypothetical protein BLE401_08900 [Beggiatoa leptomitoformis]
MLLTKDAFWLKLLACGLLIFGTKLWLIQQFGSSVPYWDQWDSLAADLFLKWSENHFSVGQLFSPHNEHRIVFSRLLALSLFAFNQGQWQPLLEAIASAGLATLVAIIAGLLLRRVVKNQDGLLLLWITVLWILPFGWENTLAGFQSAFYFMLLFSFIALWGLILHPAYQWQWWTGALLGFFAFFNVASGLLIFVAILGVKGYLFWTDKTQRLQHFPTIMLCLIILCLEFALLVPVAHHAVLKAQDISQFLLTFGKSLAFPAITHPFFSFFAFFPFTFLVLRLLWLRRPLTMNTLLVITLGIWVILQAAGISYARGAGGALPASRYMDILAIGILVNLLAFYLLHPAKESKKLSIYFYSFFSLWLLATVFNMSGLIQQNSIPALIHKRDNSLLQIQNVRAFLQTNNINTLIGKEIPYPSAERLATLLSNPTIRQFLPPSLQGFQLLTSSQTNNNPFVINGFYPTAGQYQAENVLGSYNQTGNVAQGTFISESLTLQQNVIEIAVTGYLGETGLRLGLWGEGDSEPQWITPQQLARETWVTYQLPNPKKPFKIIAVDENPNYWFAFAMPRGLGIGSLWAAWLLTHAYLIIALGLSLLLIPFALNNLKKSTDFPLTEPT